MSKLTKKERLLHSLIGIKQLFNNLGVEDLKNEIVLKDGTTETIDCYKEISLEQAIVFLEMNAYEGSNAKAVLRMGDVHEVLKPIKGLIDKSAKMERHIERLERQNKFYENTIYGITQEFDRVDDSNRLIVIIKDKLINLLINLSNI